MSINPTQPCVARIRHSKRLVVRRRVPLCRWNDLRYAWWCSRKDLDGLKGRADDVLVEFLLYSEHSSAFASPTMSPEARATIISGLEHEMETENAAGCYQARLSCYQARLSCGDGHAWPGQLAAGEACRSVCC